MPHGRAMKQKTHILKEATGSRKKSRPEGARGAKARLQGSPDRRRQDPIRTQMMGERGRKGLDEARGAFVLQ